MTGFQRPQRNAADRMADVDRFLFNARDEKVMAMTADQLATLYGVRDVRAVEAKLLARQDKLRRSSPIRGNARQSEPGGSPVERP